MLLVRDRRTVRKRLAELGVPVVRLGPSYRVRQVDLERAIVAAAVIERVANGSESAPRRPGVQLRPGARLWDAEPFAKTLALRAGARRADREGGDVA